MQSNKTSAAPWLPGLLLGCALTLAGCGGGGAPTLQNPAANVPAALDYTGPAPANSDRQGFRVSLWEGLRGDDRCGACHSLRGDQAPLFVREDDVNLAYDAALGLIDRDTPALSLLVTKVAGGHNCWEAGGDQACADTIERLIGNWLAGSGGTGKQIALIPPVDKDVGASRNFPAGSDAFRTAIHGLLTDFCSDCHRESVDMAQAPYFAETDPDLAYVAARSVINLDSPNLSRLVVRLRDEFHNCWTDCGDDANTMQSAVEQFANSIQPTQVDPDLVLSKALRLVDGVIASGGQRHEQDVVAIWEFKTGQGNVAFDTSAVDPPLNLTLSGDVVWLGGWGLTFRNGKAQGDTASSAKLTELIGRTGEYSVEAWVVPANVTQEGPARIVSYSGGTGVRNFTLGQTQYNYDFLARSSVADGNGGPALSTADADEVLQATLQHVVLTYDPANGRRIYVNGADTGATDDRLGGGLEAWDDSFAFVLGNEVSGNRAWAGQLRLVAIHNRVLSPQQIAENFAAGVGQKFFLLFRVGHLIGKPDSYIVFEVSQFDDYSYLFDKARFVVLGADPALDPVTMSGMRIGINGKEAEVGQAYSGLNLQLGGMALQDGQQVLSNLGTVIALEKGPDSDEFFLTFERLGSLSHVAAPGTLLPPAEPPVAAPASRIGLRVFDEIDATMAALTGVTRTDPDVQGTYARIRQQLPTVETIDGFLSAHQVAVAQLAIEYCNALVEDTGLRAGLFPAFDFDRDANAVSAADWNDQVVVPLMQRMLGANLASQPTPAEVGGELNTLITDPRDIKPIDPLGPDGDGVPDGLARCGGPCPSGRSAAVVKAACSALLGSAVTLLQ